jgi:uroporphyrinogen decarboxylase
MNSRERIKAIIAGEEADRCGLWLGHPVKETWDIYLKYFGCNSQEELRLMLGDDFRWFFGAPYNAPGGRGLFPIEGKEQRHGMAGPFADCENVEDVENYNWPNPDYLDIDAAVKELENAGDFYRAGGMWTCFYHNVMDLFGMENYLIKMYTNPDVVHAVTNKVCDFYYESNIRIFEKTGKLMDAFFFGNDFGTQLDLICGPDQFDEFIMPWFKKFTDLAHDFGYQVILHSCGSIYKVINRLIDANVDCVHPIQAKAANMDADTLARDFKGRITFMGGIDTQDLLVNASPEEIKADVRRVKKLLGPGIIISPSHEAILPNVPPENIKALAEAALE